MKTALMNFSRIRQSALMQIFYRGALPLSIADAAAKGASGVIALLIARYLGPELYGQYAIAASVCGIFLMVTDVGFEQELTRRGGIDANSIGQSLALNFTAIGITSAIAYGALALFLMCGVYSSEVIFLSLLMAAALIITRVHLPFRYLCLLKDCSFVTAAIQSLATICIVALTAGILYYRLGLVFIICAQLLSGSAILLVWLWWLPGIYKSPLPDRAAVIRFFRDSAPFALSNVIWIAYFNFDAFMLSLARPESEVGIYAGVYRIIGINYIVGYAVANAFTPMLYKKYATDRPGFAHTARQLAGAATAVAVPMSVLLFAFSGVFVPAIIGQSYTGGIVVAKILSTAVFFRLINFGLCEILTTGGFQMSRVRLEAAMLLFNIFLNFFLVPQYGGIGAAISTVGAEIVLFAGCLYVCIRGKLLSGPVNIRQDI